MLKIGELIYHSEYGKGSIVSISIEKDTLIVCFDKEFEVRVGEVTDTDYCFEDTRRLETTRFIEVFQSDVKKETFFTREREAYCHSCGKLISTATHRKCEECRWIMCDCHACRCNYEKGRK